MNTRAFLWLLLSLCSLPLLASDDLIIRAQFINEDGYASEADEIYRPVVGERVTLAVDVLTNSWFSKAPRFSHLTIRDAVNLKAGAFATNFSERIDGVAYAVQRREYTIFPQREGQFVIEGVEVSVWTAGKEDNTPTKHTLRSKPLLLLVQPLPPFEINDEEEGSEPSATMTHSLVASAVRLEQTFSSDLQQLNVGDVIERRIEVRASGTLGMLIPPLIWPDVSGFRQRSLSAVVDDKTNRGEFVGIRQEIRQYTLLADGDLTLPPIEFSWWDGQQWQFSELAEQSLKGVSPGHYPPSVRLMGWLEEHVLQHYSVVGLLMIGCVLMVLLWGLLWFIKFISRRLSASARRFSGSELKSWLWLNGAVLLLSSNAIVTRYYQWRSAALNPLQSVPEPYEALWNHCCVMAQERGEVSFNQRRCLLDMIRHLRQVDRALPLSSAAVSDGNSVSATVSLQPLNPR